MIVIIVGVLISLITFGAYQPAINNELLQWDDQYYVIYNPYIKALTWQNFQAMWINFYQANWTPLTLLSHALTYAVCGLEPWGHHLINIILHCLNTLWLFLLVLLLLPLVTQPTLSSSPRLEISQQTLLTASIIALLFGLHPQHVEAVAWVSARKDVLSLFFILPTFGFYLLYCQHEHFHIKWYLLALISFILALLSKPIAMTLPVILLLLDIYPLQRTALTGHRKARHWTILLEKMPFFLVSGIFLVITMFIQHEAGAMTELSVFGISERLLNAANSMILYLSKFLFPIFLSPLYPLSKEMSFIPVIAVMVVTILCGYGWYKHQYYWLVIWLFYLITLFPVLGLVQVGAQAAADRYAYLPTLPFYFLIGVAVAQIFYHGRLFAKLTVISILIIINFGLFQLTRQQVSIWKNNLTLWNYAASYSPNNSVIQGNLGFAYSAMGNDKEALKYYQLALSKKVDHPMYYDIGTIYYHAGIAHLRLKEFQEALLYFNGILENHLDIAHSYDIVYYQIGWIYSQSGLVAEAKIALTKALEINPQYQRAKDLLAQLH
ncbi:MAG: hypothetical protein BWK79_09270 [Beggiatoa sp. IS2]|nr:MAG: hypothetical protein BWK79_09270 [Beggiatoa sp. IS2]